MKRELYLTGESSWWSKRQEVGHWKPVWSQMERHLQPMSYVLLCDDKNISKSVINSTIWDHDASRTILIWIAMVMPWPKLGSSSMSRCVVLLQPGSLWMSVAYVTTSVHRRAVSHSLGTRELVLPLYSPGRTATNSLTSCSTMRAGPTLYHTQGGAGPDPW